MLAEYPAAIALLGIAIVFLIARYYAPYLLVGSILILAVANYFPHDRLAQAIAGYVTFYLPAVVMLFGLWVILYGLRNGHRKR